MKLSIIQKSYKNGRATVPKNAVWLRTESIKDGGENRMDDDRKDRKMYSDRHNSTISWLQDYEMRQAEIFREDLMLEIRWLQYQEKKKKGNENISGL